MLMWTKQPLLVSTQADMISLLVCWMWHVMWLQMTGDVGAGDMFTFWSGAWNPHDHSRLCTTGGNGVQVMSSSRFPHKQEAVIFQ